MNAKQHELVAALTGRRTTYGADWGELRKEFDTGPWVIEVYPPQASRRAGRVVRADRPQLNGLPFAQFAGAVIAIGLLMIARVPFLAAIIVAVLTNFGWMWLVGISKREVTATRSAAMSWTAIDAWVDTIKITGWPAPDDVAATGPVAEVLDLAMQYEHAAGPIDREAARWRMYDLVPMPAHLPSLDGELGSPHGR